MHHGGHERCHSVVTISAFQGFPYQLFDVKPTRSALHIRVALVIEKVQHDDAKAVREKTVTGTEGGKILQKKGSQQFCTLTDLSIGRN